MTTPASPSRTAAIAFAVDAAAVLLFCAVGRRNHDEAVTAAGIVHTAWPFLTGLVAAWLLYRAWRRPTAPWPTGVAVWLTTIVVGMTIRVVTGAGIAVSFIGVATLVTGVLLVGWRAAVKLRSAQKQPGNSPGTAQR